MMKMVLRRTKRQGSWIGCFNNALGGARGIFAALIAVSYLFAASSFAQLQQAASASSNIPQAKCQINSGDSTSAYSINVPAKTRSFGGLVWRYSSSQGWGMALPMVREEAGSLSFFDGQCWYDAFVVSANGEYTTALGYRISNLPGGGYRVQFASGGAWEFEQPFLRGPQGSIDWNLSKQTSLGAWETRYVYAGTSQSRLSSVEVDSNTLVGTGPVFTVNLAYSQGRLDEISVRSALGNEVERHRLLYSQVSGDLAAIALYGRQGGLLGEKRYSYYAGGRFQGLLQRVTSLLGGTTDYEYTLAKIKVLKRKAVGVHVERPVLHRVVVDPQTADQAPVATSYEYSGGVLDSRGVFSGFSEIRTKLSNQVSVSIFDSRADVPGLLREARIESSSGTLLERNVYVYERGGLNNKEYALVKSVSSQYSGSSVVTSGSEIVWNFNLDRPEEIISHGQCEFDFQTNTFLNSYPEDDLRMELHYFAQAPAPEMFNTLQRRVIFDASNAKVGEQIAVFDQHGFIQEVKNFNNTTNSYASAYYHFNAQGDLERIEKGTKVLQQVWQYGLLTSSVNAPGTTDLRVSYEYDPDTRLLVKATRPSGTHLRIERDEFGRLERQSVLSANEVDQFVFFEASYDVLGRTAVVTAAGVSAIHLLDGFGNIVKASDSGSGTSTFRSTVKQRGSDGLVSRFTNVNYYSADPAASAGEVLSHHGVDILRDDFGRVSQLSPDNSGDGLGVWRNSYEGEARFGSPSPNPQGKTLSGPYGRIYSRSSFSNKSSFSMGTGPEQIEYSLEYHPFEDRLADLGGNVFSNTFNSQGALLENNTSTTPYTVDYRPDGSLERITFPSGKVEEYVFDDVGRPELLRYRDPSVRRSEEYRYFWDTTLNSSLNVSKGQLAGIVGPVDALEFGYDSLGRIAQVVHRHLDGPGLTRSFAFEYDGTTGQVSRILYPTELIGGLFSVDYMYDTRAREQLISSPNLLSLVSNGVIRSVDSRNSDGVIDRVSIPQYSLEEELVFSQSSGLIKSRELRSTQTSQVVDAVVYNYDERNLVRRERGPSGNRSIEEFTQYDSRNFLEGYRRQTVGGGVGNYTIVRDSLGRQVYEPESGDGFFYNPNSNHPYQPDGLTNSGQIHPWTYNADNQLVHLRGKNSAQDLDFEYGPDAEVSKITNAAGDEMSLVRGVLGNVIKLRIVGANGQQKYLRRKYLFGDYTETTTPQAGTVAAFRVPGETTAGGHGIVATVLFDVNGTSPLGDPSRQDPVIVPNPRLCGNGRMDPGEQCDGGTATCAQPMHSQCIGCLCHLTNRPPPPRRVIMHTPYGDVDDRGLSSNGSNQPLKPEHFGEESFEGQGFPVSVSGDCDEVRAVFTLADARRLSDAMVAAAEACPKHGSGKISSDVSSGMFGADSCSCLLGSSFSRESYLPMGHICMPWRDSSGNVVPCNHGAAPKVDPNWKPVTPIGVVQGVLDGLGCVDPTPICDGLNAAIYAVRGEWVDAGLSSAAMLPFAFDGLKAGRYCDEAGEAGEILFREWAGGFVRHSDEVTELYRHSRHTRAADLIIPLRDDQYAHAVFHFDDILKLAPTNRHGIPTLDPHGFYWMPGNPVNFLTYRGHVPSWNTVRKRLWQNEARYFPNRYTWDNLKLMKKGKAPFILNPFSGLIEKVELHHFVRQAEGGLYEVIPLARTNHDSIHAFVGF